MEEVLSVALADISCSCATILLLGILICESTFCLLIS